MKIQIMGFAGSGKSTLARDLAKQLDLPVLYLDTVYWMAGWQPRNLPGQREILGRFLDENDAAGWVIDGNYSKNLLERRAAEADAILFLNFGRLRCFRRIMKRARESRGQNRFSMAEGCPEKVDWEFIRWAMWDSRTEVNLQKFAPVREAYPEKYREFKNPRQLRRYLAGDPFGQQETFFPE